MARTMRNTTIVLLVTVAHAIALLALAKTGTEPAVNSSAPQVLAVTVVAQSDAASAPMPEAVPQPPQPVAQRVEPPRPRPRPSQRPVPRPAPAISAPVAPPEPSAAPVAVEAETQQITDAAQTQTSSGGSQQAMSAASEQAVVMPSFDASYLHNTAPTYSDQSRRAGEHGRVTLRVLVTAEGRAGRVEIKTSSGYRRLDDAARRAVQRWRFIPARRNGVAVDMWYDVPIDFSLQG